MILTIICGATGTGKTHFTKEFSKRYPLRAVYDIQNEYNLKQFDAKNNNKQFSVLDKKQFIGFTQKLRGYCFVIEECTAVFDGKAEKDFIHSILSKRHTHNRYILVFHSLHRVPKNLMEFCDYLVLFRTNDFDFEVKKKYPQFLAEWKAIQKAPRFTKKVFKISVLAENNMY